MKQLITIGKDGSLFGLDHKKKGLDLALFGLAMKERVSDIVWNEKYQKWFIKFRNVGDNQFTGWSVGTEVTNKAGVFWPSLQGVSIPNGLGILCFTDYEDAVAAEVAILQGLQMKGIFKI